MWVFCCGAIRSGSTLQYNIACEIVELSGRGIRIDYHHHSRFADVRSHYKDYKGYKVFKTHQINEEIKHEFLNQNAIGIYSYRDVRDVFLSIKRKENKSSDNLFQSSFIKKYIKCYFDWLVIEPMYRSKYEDLIRNIRKEITNICNILEVSLAETEISDIEKKVQKDSQKKIADRLAQYGDSYDKRTLIHSNHFNSKRPNEWKLDLSQDEICRIEKEARDWLFNNGYELTSEKRNGKVKFYSFSQNGEDVCIFNFFDRKRKGTIIEVGAFDGRHLSNSYNLDKIGWNSVCIEPNPKYYNILIRNRPKAVCYNVAASDKESELEIMFDELGLLSGHNISKSGLDAKYQKRGLKFDSLENQKVPCITLDRLISKLNISRIDCISIDVEGHELSVLRGLNLKKTKPKLLIVEANSEELKEMIVQNLLEYNYYLLYEISVNLFFGQDLEDRRKLIVDKNSFIKINQWHPLGWEFTIKPKRISVAKGYLNKLKRVIGKYYFSTHP